MKRVVEVIVIMLWIMRAQISLALGINQPWLHSPITSLRISLIFQIYKLDNMFLLLFSAWEINSFVLLLLFAWWVQFHAWYRRGARYPVLEVW